MGVLYILDEPSIGLHQRDNQRLLASLERLRDQGNTVLVVEHDEETIRAADHVVDMGPGAGSHGGLDRGRGIPRRSTMTAARATSITGAFLAGPPRTSPCPDPPADPPERRLRAQGLPREQPQGRHPHAPLGLFTVVTGVSGSGKSTLVNDTLYRALAARGFTAPTARPGALRARSLGLEHLDKVIDVEPGTHRPHPPQQPRHLHRGPRRHPKALQPGARGPVRGYAPGRFSFNVKGGRCEACQGDGTLRVGDALPARPLRALRGLWRRALLTARPWRSPTRGGSSPTCWT